MSLERISPLLFEAGGKKFRLRPLEMSDQEALVKFAKRNFGVINGPFPVTTEALTKGHRQAEAWIREKVNHCKEDKGIVLLIEHLGDSRITGYVSAFMFDWRIPKCELAWMVDANFQRKGIATICCRYILDFLTDELGLQKIICRIDPKNTASVMLAEKLKFVREGHHRRDFRDGYGRLLDVSYFALLPEH